jgi:hypothetical protein
MKGPPDGASAVPALAAYIVRIASWLIPKPARGEWQREWRAELWHLYRELKSRGGPSAREQVAFVRRSLGSVLDALQLRFGDAQLWRESVFDVARRWERQPWSVAAALLFLSLAIAADGVLLVFGELMVEAPRSVWSGLARETQLLILGVAATCGITLIVASAVTATQLLGFADRSLHHNGVWIVETVLVAGITGWLGRWIAEFFIRSAFPPDPRSGTAAADLSAAVTTACVLSWLGAITVLAGLRTCGRRAATVREA